MSAHTESEFNDFMSQLRKTNQTLSYFFVDFDKVTNNVNKVRINLNLLNSLVNCIDIKNTINDIFEEYGAKPFEALEILIAVRDSRKGIWVVDKSPMDEPKDLATMFKYLLGSVNSAIIVSRVFHGDDIRRHGSGNAGLTNMLRTYGKGAAGLTLLGDVLKTAVSICLAGVLFGFSYIAGISVQGYGYLAGFMTVIGHVFPIYYGFRGGKGVLATAVTALILSPIVFLILLLIFIAIVAMSKYVSLGSVSVAVLYPVLINAYIRVAMDAAPDIITAMTTIMLAILIVICHRGNLKRISDRTEHKISFGKKNDVHKLSLEENNDDD